MEISLDRNTLSNALSHLHGITARKTTVPILSHILLEAKNDSLYLSATDLDVAIRKEIPATVKTPGSATISASLLYEIVRKLSKDTSVFLSLDAVNSQLSLKSNRSTFKLASLDPQDFPAIQMKNLPYHFLLPALDFVKLIEKTIFSAAEEEVRYYLNGIFLHRDGFYLCTAATDGHRLATTRVPLPVNAQDIPSVILSKKCVQHALSLAYESTTDIEVSLSDSQISFQFDGTYLTARLMDGVYPDYKSVIPTHHDKVIFVDMDLFSKAVDRIATVSSEKNRCVRLKLSPKRLQITAIGNENSFGDEEIETDYQGEPIDFVFNHHYLLDISKKFKSTDAVIKLHNVATAALIQEHLDEDSLYLIMPMRG